MAIESAEFPLLLLQIMDTAGVFFFLIISSLLLSIFNPSVSADGLCDSSYSCSQTGPTIQFPFWLIGEQPDICGYEGFGLRCNNKSQTILSLPFAGDFRVKSIDYIRQAIFINDPDSCLPNRMQNFTVESPFRPVFSREYRFLNCSSNLTEFSGSTVPRAVPLFCLSSGNHTVYAVPYLQSDQEFPSSCAEITSARWTVSRFWSMMNFRGDLHLKWVDPRCWPCAAQGMSCGLTGTDQMGCVSPSRTGLPRSAKYGIIVGVGIPALVFITGLVCYACGWIRIQGLQRRLDLENSATIAPQTVATVTGLDGQVIESYPKTVLGESRRLPEPSDATCPICLCEYQPKETLRTLPECNHYFHASCIDEWLKLNGTCPLCRSSPESRSMTPCSSLSSSTSTSTTSRS